MQMQSPEINKKIDLYSFNQNSKFLAVLLKSLLKKNIWIESVTIIRQQTEK